MDTPYTLTETATDDGTLITAVHDVEVDWSDQTGWFDPTKVDSAITLIGCGGIGSNIAFELITMGFMRFVLYDDDKVEPRNLASQKAFRHRDLFKPKASALAEVLFEYGATEVLVRNRRLTADDTIDTPLLVGGVDSMASRHIVWEVVKNSPDVELYLDGRLDGLVAQVFAIDPLDADWYEKDWMFDDAHASKAGNCTMRTVVFPATWLSSTMCRHLSNWFMGFPVCRFIQNDLANMVIDKRGDVEE